MENWRDVVTAYPDNPEPKDYEKAIQTVQNILSRDLAPFEIEWLAHTLLFKPIYLFETITTKRASVEWQKIISDSFKILSKIIDKYWDVVENYYSDVIELCMLSFGAQPRKAALICLLSVVRRPSVDISDDVVRRLVGALEQSKTCKAPLALNVGTICRYHPEKVQEHFSRIWRVYLNMLQPNNKTDNIVSAVLLGISGLFEYFGDELETNQLNSFYDRMTKEFLKIPVCLDGVLMILKHHANLFKERLSEDIAVRQYLWQIEKQTAMDALSSVYDQIFTELHIQSAVTSELNARAQQPCALVRHTAALVVQRANMAACGAAGHVDIEFLLRSRKLSYEEADTVSWCIESSVSNSDTMLLNAIMYYDNLPSHKKTDIIVKGFLKASDVVRKAALVLLLKLCLQDHLDTYIDLWRTLLDNTSGPDLGKAVIMFEEAVHHLVEVLASCVEESDKVYEELRPILSLLSILLSLQKTELQTGDWCLSISPTIVHLAKKLYVTPLKMLSETPENEVIYVEKFEEDTVLSKLLSTLSKEGTSQNDTLTDLQVIFSREGADLELLTQALNKLELLLRTENNNLNKQQLSMIISQMMKLKSKSVLDLDDKNARIFQKDVAMFLGKYGYLAHEENFTEDLYVLKFKNKIILNIPNVIEGTSYKVDLQRIFQLCLLWGETDALYCLLVILSANLCDRPDPHLQEATIRVIHALFKHSADSKLSLVLPALVMCKSPASVQHIMNAITEESSPDVRRILSECLEFLLTHDPGSESTAQLLNIVGEQALFMISRDDASTIIPGLDITKAFISALKDNNSLTVEYLPNIIINTSNEIASITCGNTSKPYGNTPKSCENTSKTYENISETDEDTSKTNENVTETLERATKFCMERRIDFDVPIAIYGDSPTNPDLIDLMNTLKPVGTSSKTNENTAKTKKKTSKTNENTSKTNKNTAKTNENTSKTNENTSKTNENTSKTNENTSKTNENTSKTNENTSKTNENTSKTFEISTKFFLDKIDLFTDDQIKNNIVKLYDKSATNTDLSEANITQIMEFTKSVIDLKKYDYFFVDEVLDMCKKLTILSPQFLNLVAMIAFANKTFEFPKEIRRKIVGFENYYILEQILDVEVNIDAFKINAVLVFFKEYAEELKEENLEKTLKCLSNLIENITPSYVLLLKNNLYECFHLYKSDELIASYEKWAKMQNLNNITELLEEKRLFTEFSDQLSDVILSVKILSNIFNTPLSQVKNWTGLIVENLSDLEIKWGKIFLTDLLCVAEKNLTVEEFENILENIDFVKSYISVYFKRLIAKPFALGDKTQLLVDIVDYFSKTFKEEYFENVLELVDYYWPKFEQTSSFDDKLSILLNLHRLPKRVQINNKAVQWGINLLTSEETRIDHKSKIICTLPARNEYSIYYKSFAASLPSRLAEMKGEFITPFRGLLDTLSSNGDLTLLDIVITLVGFNDTDLLWSYTSGQRMAPMIDYNIAGDTTGWWDHAIDACIKSLAAKEDVNILNKAYKRIGTSSDMVICKKIFLPLLRHSSRKFCETYTCTIVGDLFKTLKKGSREPSNAESYRKRVVAYTNAFNILKVVFEKVPEENLKTGPLNESAGSPKPWYFVEQTCMYCVTLRGVVKCPPNAFYSIKETCFSFYCSSYNCLVAAIIRRKPKQKLYTRIFNLQAWDSIVDKRATFKFPLQAYSRHRGSKPMKQSVETFAVSSSISGTVRSRLFLTTLSENPLQYDMIPDEEDDEEEDDIPLEIEDSGLNAQGCLSSVTAMLEHASTLSHTNWRTTLLEALTQNSHRNEKYLLAQAICNSDESLKPHSSHLCPGLFQFIADTPETNNGISVLNNLHVDVLTTIIRWEPTDLPHSSYVDTTVEYLICTCIENKHRRSIYRRLLNTLNGILQLYGNNVKVKWDVFEGQTTFITSLLPIFERLLKNKVNLPDLLPNIFALNAKQWASSIKLAEVAGLAFSLADSVSREQFLAKFWSILNTIRPSSVNSYVKILFYAQKNCEKCCDFRQFKIITDLAPKVEKSKCLSIISCYLEHVTEPNDYFTDMFQIVSLKELFDTELRVEAMRIAKNSLKFMEVGMRREIVQAAGDNCRNSSVAVRKEAFSVILKAFQDLVKTNHHATKRQAVDSSTILNIIDSTEFDKFIINKIFHGIFDNDDDVANMVIDGVEEKLSKDVAMRFAELFYMIVYQSSVSEVDGELPNYCSTLVGLLFSELRAQDAFKDIKLRDEGLPQSILNAAASITSKSYTKSLLRSGVTFRPKVKNPEREIDVQMPIIDILEVFLQLSKINSEICHELCVQIMKCLQGTGRRFDLDAAMSRQLFDIMKKKPNCLTPLIIDACRIFINKVSSIEGFKESVCELKQGVYNTDGYLHTSILYEDLQLRNIDRKLFVLSFTKEDIDIEMKSSEFSLDAITKIFGCLSNWDDLRSQEKDNIQDSLPPLWTKEDDFVVSLREYFEKSDKKLDYNLWFHKMVASYYFEEVTQDRISWLKGLDKWPTSDFVTSAVIEAIQWHQSDYNVVTDISSSDCLAEWAARLMIRSAFNKQNIASQCQEGVSRDTRADELQWCTEANERGLPKLALQCIERNKQDLLDVEMLPWIREKVKASRIIGLKENNESILQKALDAARKQTTQFAKLSSFDTNINMLKLILEINHDLKSLTLNNVDLIMQEVTGHTIRNGRDRVMCSNNKQALKSLYEMATIFYDELWIEDDELTQNEIISNMAEIIEKVLDYNLAQDYNLLFSILLNRLAYSETTMSDETAKKLLKQIYRVFHNLDSITIDILKKVVSVLPPSVVTQDYIDKLHDTSLDECKEYFQLICDVNYSLLQYCEQLKRNVLDDTEWDNVFERMKKRLFESKHGGSDYQTLNTIKNKLYELEDMTSYDDKSVLLTQVLEGLSKRMRSSVQLSQVCAPLRREGALEDKKRALQALLSLPHNVYVVKFQEQVTVFTDSIRRPCVVKALLSNGITKRFIVKTGEPMYRDASVQRSVAVLKSISPGLQARSYNVTPLGDDSAIIEFLEDYARLRDLMEEKHDINNIAVNRIANDKLILAPSLALEQYKTMCDAVPTYVLRSSIEINSSCVKEFIAKKRTFEDTLSAMTIVNWLFGVGDRHLQNIMYDVRDGSLCGVDWASIFQYGSHELPPARLTANLLAVCDVKVLESRLQNTLMSLRNSRKMYEAFIRTSFHWQGEHFTEIKHIQDILAGNTVSYELTKASLENSNRKYKEHYISLLNQVFENFAEKHSYSVEEQVSCLLQHCTDPKILSVTPPGWEAWL